MPTLRNKMTNHNDILRAEKAFLRAVVDGEINELRELILNGLDVNIIMDDGVTLLMEAVSEEDIEVVKALVDLGADVNIHREENNPLWMAANWGYEEIFNFLAPFASPDLYQEAIAELRQGIIRRERRENVVLDRLTTATLFRDVEAILEIIRDGFDINTITENGDTVLIAPSCWGFYEIVQVLVDNGADVNFCSEDGSSTALIEAAAGLGAIKYHAFLANKAKHQHITVMKTLLNAGANVNASMNEGWTALIAAINSQSVEAVQLLIDYGADVNTKYREYTTLGFARERGDNEIIQLLIDAGAIE